VLGSGGRGSGFSAGDQSRWSTQVRARRRIKEARPSGERWMWQMGVCVCDRRQRGGDKGRAVRLPGQRREEGGVLGGAGDRGVCSRQSIDVGRGRDLDQAPGRAVGYREIHCCCAWGGDGLGGHGINRQPSHRTGWSARTAAVATSKDSSGCEDWTHFAIALFECPPRASQSQPPIRLRSAGAGAGAGAGAAMLRCIHCCSLVARCCTDRVACGEGLRPWMRHDNCIERLTRLLQPTPPPCLPQRVTLGLARKAAAGSPCPLGRCDAASSVSAAAAAAAAAAGHLSARLASSRLPRAARSARVVSPFQLSSGGPAAWVPSSRAHNAGPLIGCSPPPPPKAAIWGLWATQAASCGDINGRPLDRSCAPSSACDAVHLDGRLSCRSPEHTTLLLNMTQTARTRSCQLTICAPAGCYRRRCCADQRPTFLSEGHLRLRPTKSPLPSSSQPHGVVVGPFSSDLPSVVRRLPPDRASCVLRTQLAEIAASVLPEGPSAAS
jgi:hypothetical protein